MQKNSGDLLIGHRLPRASYCLPASRRQRSHMARVSTQNRAMDVCV